MMKEHYPMGLGVHKSAEVITLDHENRLFEEGILDEDNSEKLLNTIIYMIRMHCARGSEHNRLHRSRCESQLSVQKDDHGKKCSVYVEYPL